jgi:preprotein translocase subunit YajC
MIFSLATLPILLAQDSPPSGGGLSFLGGGFVPILLMIAMFYLLLIRPQQKQRKELEKRIASLEKGDRVITTGGLHGTVHQISEKTVTLKSGGENVFLTFDKPAVATVIKAKGEKSEKNEKASKSETGKTKDTKSEVKDAEVIEEKKK